MSEARTFLFPYCLDRLADGRYIALNRNYKPLGIQTGEWVKYEEHPSAMPLKITAKDAEKLSWSGSDALDRIYLYSDGCVPTDGKDHLAGYQKRLAVLMALQLLK